MYIERTISKHIEKYLLPGGNKQPAIILYGPRQVGKTTLVKHIEQQYSEQSVYFNCDYADVRAEFSYDRMGSIGSLIGEKKLLILDEAQRIENIGLILKILVDEFPTVQVIATGSSSFDLSNKIAEPLTGRKHELHLHPFSYEELLAQKEPLMRQRALERLLIYGSYPEVALKSDDDARMKLQEIGTSYLFKDIFTFQHLRKPEVLEKLLRLLALQIGQEVSYHELAQALGIDQTVVQNYIALLESAFVIFRLGAYRKNLRTELKKSRKIYFWDLGIRNTIINNFQTLALRDDVGALWENFCIAERMKRNGNHQKQIQSFFWRTYRQQEIDYIELDEHALLHAYECKWNTQKRSKVPRPFAEAYPDATFDTVNPTSIDTFLV